MTDFWLMYKAPRLIRLFSINQIDEFLSNAFTHSFTIRLHKKIPLSTYIMMVNIICNLTPFAICICKREILDKNYRLLWRGSWVNIFLNKSIAFWFFDSALLMFYVFLKKMNQQIDQIQSTSWFQWFSIPLKHPLMLSICLFYLMLWGRHCIVHMHFPYLRFWRTMAGHGAFVEKMTHLGTNIRT